jgi:predicted nucleotidyltransferase
VAAQGNQKHYKANTAAPVFKELRGLVLKTSGLVDVLRSFLAPLAGQIDAAFVYGSIPKRQDTASSDVDLMVISDSLGYSDLFPVMEDAGARLGRKVNPTIYTRAELAKRIKQKNAFATRILTQEKLWVIGNEETLYGVPA